MAEKYKTCKHSTGRVGELIVYVHPTCPRLSKATDRKATEAVNTIRIYCKNNDIYDCVFNCAIRQVCRGYFRNLNVPMLWPEVEVPDD